MSSRYGAARLDAARQAVRGKGGIPITNVDDAATRDAIEAISRALDGIERRLPTEVASGVPVTQPSTKFTFLVPKIQKANNKIFFYAREISHRPGEPLLMSSDRRVAEIDIPASVQTNTTVLDTGVSGVILKVGWPED